MTVIHIEDVMRDGMDAVIAQTLRVLGDGPVYVTIDVDGLTRHTHRVRERRK